MRDKRQENELDSLLRSWSPEIPASNDFRARVWQKISLQSQEHSQWDFSFGWLLRILNLRQAFAIFATVILLNVGLASWMAGRQSISMDEQAQVESFYAQQLDPYSRLLAMEEIP